MSTSSQFTGGAIKSIQRGKITLTGVTSNTATITAVDTSKTELRMLGSTYNGVTLADVLTMIELTNSTTITATRAASGSTAVVSWELTEFY
jgi:hypothetical protein